MGRLTRQELGWLLAQEARGAARILRQDVTLRSQPPPLADIAPAMSSESDLRVETTLNVLDDAIGMLSELEGGPASRAQSRRGRIDLAALLWEFAPIASISIEPGAGTEVFGEEGELRRMLHVLVSQTHFGSTHDAAVAPVRIRRQADWIRISVNLGPDVSANTDLERRWLSRMATRMGGRLELEGGTMSLILPADASNDQSEVADLRKELVQAQQLGEAYARELATAFAAGQTPEPEVVRDHRDVGLRRFELLVSLASALHRSLAPIFHALEGDARTNPGPLATGFALLGELGRIASCPTTETPERVDVARTAREVATDAEARASRHDVTFQLTTPAQLSIASRPRALSLLLRALLEHAIAATPKGGTVRMFVTDENGAVKVAVADGGPAVPSAASADLLEHRIDPASLGRPPGFGLLVAQVSATYLGFIVEFADSAEATTAVVRLRPL